MIKSCLFFVFGFLLAFQSTSAQTSETLTDFKIQLEWSEQPDPKHLSESKAFRWYHSPRVIPYICNRKERENINGLLAGKTVSLNEGKRSTEAPELSGCVLLGRLFDFKRAGKYYPDLRPTEQMPYPVELRDPEGVQRWTSVFIEFSAVDFYKRSLLDLRVTDISDAELTLTFWRVGTNAIANPVMEFLDLQSVDLLKANLAGGTRQEVVLDSATSLGAERSSKAKIAVDFEMLPVARTSPYYDLNVPNELLRPSIIGLLTGKQKGDPVQLRDVLAVSNLYFSFQEEKVMNEIWALLKDNLTKINFKKSEPLEHFLAQESVKRVLEMNSDEALNVYLYYYRANLEDVDHRLTLVQASERADPRNLVVTQGALNLSTESQEALARYELNQRRVRDTIILLDLVGITGRNYLDKVLR